MTDTNRLSDLVLDDTGLPAPTPEIEQERRIAIFDLLENNLFELPGRDGVPAPTGPFHLKLSVRDGKLAFEVANENAEPQGAFYLSLSPLRQVIRDYFQICESYFSAVKNLPPSQIETIDMARRGLHNEAATLLVERLDGKIDLDFDTARRLITLITLVALVALIFLG